jgi:hypothetical protein
MSKAKRSGSPRPWPRSGCRGWRIAPAGSSSSRFSAEPRCPSLQSAVLFRTQSCPASARWARLRANLPIGRHRRSSYAHLIASDPKMPMPSSPGFLPAAAAPEADERGPDIISLLPAKPVRPLASPTQLSETMLPPSPPSLARRDPARAGRRSAVRDGGPRPGACGHRGREPRPDTGPIRS